LEVLAPDVNESGWKFTPVSATQIRFGLGAVRGVGEGAAGAILAARRDEGPFSSLFNLVDRIDLRAAGRRTLEALTLAGACDSFGHRAQILEGLEIMIREAQLRAEERISGQASLFDTFGASDTAPLPRQEPILPDLAPWTESERLTREKEILGFFISGHPLERYREEVRVFEGVNTANLVEYRDQKVEVACVVTGISRQVSRKTGGEWGRLTVEDFHGTAMVLAFGDVWEQYHDLLVQDAPVLIRGTVSGRERDEDAPPIFLDDVVPLGALVDGGSLGVELRLTPAITEIESVTAAVRIFKEHPGRSPLYVRWSPASAELENGNGTGREERGVERFRSRTLNVNPNQVLIEELRELFGVEGVRLIRI
jgi:DNA polymerase-3 subunit alpha